MRSRYVTGRTLDLVQTRPGHTAERPTGPVHAVLEGTGDVLGMARSVCDRPVQLAHPVEWPPQEIVSVGVCEECREQTG